LFRHLLLQIGGANIENHRRRRSPRKKRLGSLLLLSAARAISDAHRPFAKVR
jgi:hypothetical protein